MRNSCSGAVERGTLCYKKKTCRTLVMLVSSQECRKLKVSGMAKDTPHSLRAVFSKARVATDRYRQSYLRT